MKRLLLIFLAAFAISKGSASAAELAHARTAAEWQAMARSDLEAAHALILSSHPGVIDTANPGFNDWVKSGYSQALALIPQVVSYDTALSAVRYYITGFLDGHLSYSDDIRRDFPVIHDGWSVDFEHGKYVVVAALPNWPVAQPPIGAELVACDGRSPDAIIRNEVAPFFDRRDDPFTTPSLAPFLGSLHLANRRLRSCRFRTAEGSIRDLRVAYRPISTDALFSTFVHASDGSKRPTNSFTFQDGVLWIRAGNFSLQSGSSDEADLEAMLKALPDVVGVRRIVFDTRGNGGGDSSIGGRIFDAATGGLDFDRTGIENLPRTYAQWRVSDTLLATVTDALARNKSLYGDTSGRAVESQQFLDQIKAAKSAGEQWIEQKDSDYRITRADIAARHGKLRRFDGKVMLVTDSRCASACLDFADLVLQVPGSIQLGQTTSSDTLYIDVGMPKLPSGNRLVMPLKVWRNRLRGNAESLKPDIPLDVDMDDDAAVRQAVLAVVP